MNDPKPPSRDLFEAALALDPAERAAFLAGHCVDDAQRAVVERMLEADADADSHVLDDSFDVLLGRVGESEGDAETISPIGSTVGPFTLQEKLGEGGSSIVFRATREQSGVIQTVALKLLRRGLYSREEQRRFRSERLALAQLRHPGIARLIEGGVTDSGVPYIALELIDGEPITEYAREQRLDLRHRLQLFVAICRAVEAAHRALIVHRDLKPSNVLVTREGEIKLLDFGIAKLLDADLEADATHTQQHAMTPAYAAPEQFSRGAITTATDVYALGILLAELITGSRREPGDSHTPSSRISDDTAPGVLPAPPKVTRRQLRGDLDNIVMKATSSEPEPRYASAGRFADDIERHLAGHPVAAHPPSRWYRTRKFVSRHKGGVMTTVAFLLAIFAALGVALWQANVALEQSRIAREQAQRAETVRQFLSGVFEQAEPDAHKGQSISAHQLLENGEQQLSKHLDEQPAIRADLTALIGSLYWGLGDYARAQPLLRAAVAVGADPRVPDAINARNLRWLARTENDQHAFDEAINHARQAIALSKSASVDDAEEAAAAQRVLIEGLVGRGDAKGAEPLARAELAHDRIEHGDISAAAAADWLLLARTLDTLSRFDESASAFSQTIRIDRTLHGDRSSRVSGDLNALGLMLWEKRDFAESEKALREALDIDEQVYGADHGETLAVRSNLIGTLEHENHWQEALDARLQLLEIQKKLLGETRPEELADSYNLIGSNYRMLGRYREAQAATRDSIRWWTKAQGSGGWDSAQPL
ncbi:MAG TPA: serine/threonine-protein kinase, partial [Dokdonella sp.]